MFIVLLSTSKAKKKLYFCRLNKLKRTGVRESATPFKSRIAAENIASGFKFGKVVDLDHPLGIENPLERVFSKGPRKKIDWLNIGKNLSAAQKKG